MEKLKEKLDKMIDNLSSEKSKELRNRLDNLMSVYPFNEYEYIISNMLGLEKITLDNYFEIRDEYIARNMYLHIYEIAGPRTFGEQWGQCHIKELVPDLEKPTKKLDPDYSGQYDFWLHDNHEHKITIEVKASRAVDAKSREALPVKALSQDSELPFDMNFQQIKPKCADVFIWIGVWRDVIKYWVLASKEVEMNKYYSKGQHRGNKGEGQLHIKHDNMKDFTQFQIESNKLREAIVAAYHRHHE
jgi:hypothetical protein